MADEQVDEVVDAGRGNVPKAGVLLSVSGALRMLMNAARFLSLIWIFSLLVGFWAVAASGLVIYRFGGADRPSPPEAGSDGVAILA